MCWSWSGGRRFAALSGAGLRPWQVPVCSPGRCRFAALSGAGLQPCQVPVCGPGRVLVCGPGRCRFAALSGAGLRPCQVPVYSPVRCRFTALSGAGLRPWQVPVARGPDLSAERHKAIHGASARAFPGAGGPPTGSGPLAPLTLCFSM